MRPIERMKRPESGKRPEVLLCTGCLLLALSFPTGACAESEVQGVLNCDEETRITGIAIFSSGDSAKGLAMRLLVQGTTDNGDSVSLTLDRPNGLPAPGTEPVGEEQGVVGRLVLSRARQVFSGAVKSGTWTTSRVSETGIEGNVDLRARLLRQPDLEEAFVCLFRAGFGAVPGMPAEIPAPGAEPVIPPPTESDPEPPPILIEEPPPPGAEPPQSLTCQDGPLAGRWTLTAGKMTVGGMFTPLGGGVVTGTVSIDGDGRIINANFPDIGSLRFEPMAGSHPPLTGRLYHATRLPAAFSDGIYWYLGCQTPSTMVSTTGIKESHRRGGPPLVQFHRWQRQN